jgi:hypothetical protein
MREVAIDKERLEKAVRKNRDGHRALYEQAIEGYRRAVIAWFEEQIDAAKNGGRPYETYFREPRPEDHTPEYDRVLRMLLFEEGDTVKLTNAEFAQYVLDDWGWKRDFLATSANYIGEHG